MNLLLTVSSAALTLHVATSALAAPTRTPWQQHDGLEPGPLGLIPFSCVPAFHGANCEYDVATIPDGADAGWFGAPDGEIINFSIPSRVCSAPINCMRYGDFTYFQTLVDVPADTVVTQFTIAFSGMDDGSRVTVFNSVYPSGFVVPGSYVYLGGSGTTDLSALVQSGEINRVVVTQVDDCCSANNLREARVVLNGEVVHTGCSSDDECNDDDACSTDTCQADGSCTHEAISCDDSDACTIDSCDTAIGCTQEAVDCNDGDACTTDICDAVLGCTQDIVDCEDGSVCTIDSCDPFLGCQASPLNCDDGNTCTLDACDPVGGCANIEQCPDCSAAAPSVATIWPPNHHWIDVDVLDVADPQGQPVAISIDAIFQDEPTNTTGDGNTCVDGQGIESSTAQVRAERTGTRKVPGDGRVYHIYFTATDPDGNLCQGEVTSCVPHDQGQHSTCVDGGALYDSLVCL